MIQDILNMEGESVKRRHDLIPVSKSVLLGIDSLPDQTYTGSNSFYPCSKDILWYKFEFLGYVSYRMWHTVCRDVGCPDSEALDESLNSNWSTHNLFYFYSLWKPLRRSGKYAVYCTIQVNCYSRVIIIGHETIGT